MTFSLPQIVNEKPSDDLETIRSLTQAVLSKKEVLTSTCFIEGLWRKLCEELLDLTEAQTYDSVSPLTLMLITGGLRVGGVGGAIAPQCLDDR